MGGVPKRRVRLTLAEPLKPDAYTLRIAPTVTATNSGLALDGEYFGQLPTGDGVPGGEAVLPLRVLGARASRSHGGRNALLGNAASRHARQKPTPLIPIAGTQFTKTSAIEDPLLKVPPASRGNRTRARFPSRIGGNLQEGGNCKLCLCGWYKYISVHRLQGHMSNATDRTIVV